MISIIVPTYNSGKVLKVAIDSVINQTYTDWEVLIMDGASKDDTISIAESFHDPRIRIYSEPDQGVYDAMNKGISKSKGDWLYFLGSNDYLFDSEVLARIVAYLDKRWDVVYGEVDSDLDEKNMGEWTLDKLSYNRCHQCIFYNRDFFKSGLQYNLKYKILADYDLNLQWLLNKKYSWKHVFVFVAHYSTNGLSSIVYDEAFYNDYGRLLIKYNKGMLPSRYKKIAAKLYLKNNTLSCVERLMWNLYYCFQYSVQHVQQLFGVSQEQFLKI